MPEKHSTIRDGKPLVWYTENLWARSKSLQPFDVELTAIRELIILNVDGSLMDGGHRVCKALLDGRKTIRAVRFQAMPEPDEIQPHPVETYGTNQ